MEIIFDNSDARLPIEKETVSIKRTLNLKEDKFFLEGKNVTKTDITNLLESAGFSKANPYYIVQQGKIMSLANMREDQYLDLLREVAGTRVYDERRTESVRLMEESRAKLQRIQDLLGFVDDKLNELKEESKELDEYVQYDKEKRLLEYVYHEKQVYKAKQTLEECGRRRTDILRESAKQNEMVETAVGAAKEYEELLNSIRSNQKEQVHRKEDAVRRISTMSEEKATKHVEIKTIQDSIDNENHMRDEADRQIKRIRLRIESNEKELGDLIAKLNDAKNEELEITNQLEEVNRNKEFLVGKQSRFQEFKTIDERNQFLRKKIDDIKKGLNRNENKLDKTEKQRDAIENRLARAKAELPERQKEFDNVREEKETISEVHLSLKKKAEEMNNSLRDVWAKDRTFGDQYKAAKNLVNQKERDFEMTLGRGTY